MLLPDGKNGSNSPAEHSYNLHSLPMAEDCVKRPLRTDTNMSENCSVWIQKLSLTNLWSCSKVKMFSFLIGLMLTSIIMASYIFSWDKRGLLFTLSPNQFRPVAIMTGTTAAQASTEKNLRDMKLLVKIIGSKLEYSPRKVPDKQAVIETNSRLFSVLPRHFLPGIKSPCWYEEVSGELSADPYRRNHFTLRSKSFRTVCDNLKTNFQQHLQHRGGKLLRLRCLPFFYIIGQPKCGTTDLFYRLLLHPQVKINTIKEPHWWTRKRFGYIHFKDGFKDFFPVEDYLDLFDLAAHNIQREISRNSSGGHRVLQFLTGEASASTMWDNVAWSYLHKDKEETEPLFLAQDFIHTVHPGAKIIIMLRDPVERLYSDYLYFMMANKSVEDFHQKVVESVLLFQSCLSGKSLRFCVYSSSLYEAMPVRLSVGMYIVFLLDWLTVFQREQILVLQLEDYAANLRVSIKKVFDFLGVGPLSKQVEAAVISRPRSNTRRAEDRNLGSMLPATRDLLREFYQPFNHKLASVLNNEAFLWSNT